MLHCQAIQCCLLLMKKLVKLMHNERVQRPSVQENPVLNAWYPILNSQNAYQAFRTETIPVWREIGMGFSRMSGEATNAGKENSLRIMNGTFPISHEWLSRRDEIKIPHERRSRE